MLTVVHAVQCIGSRHELSIFFFVVGTLSVEDLYLLALARICALPSAKPPKRGHMHTPSEKQHTCIQVYSGPKCTVVKRTF